MGFGKACCESFGVTYVRPTFLAFSSDSTRLIAGGSDVRIWDLREPDAPPIVFSAGKASIRSVAISADDGYLAVGDAQGNVWLWRLWTAAADYLCTRVSRNLSLKEWRFTSANPYRTNARAPCCLPVLVFPEHQYRLERVVNLVGQGTNRFYNLPHVPSHPRRCLLRLPRQRATVVLLPGYSNWRERRHECP